MSSSSDCQMEHIPIVSTVIYSLIFGLSFSIIAYILMPKAADLLLKANQHGRDINKPNKPVIPESLGVFVGAIYLIALISFIPIPLIRYLQNGGGCGSNAAASLDPSHLAQVFPHHWFSVYLAALLSISCMVLLGFADDVLELRWRDKLILPAIASLPLLLVYYVAVGKTHVVVPIFLRAYLNTSVIELGFLYYLYMGALAIFCTNAINILAGVNGLEVGQSLIIACFILLHNVTELIRPFQSFLSQTQSKEENSTRPYNYELFSIVFIVPFIFLSAVLLKYNWYPARVFVGDTYCYFAGMTLAVTGILGHFSKTMLLFFAPQIFNFLMGAVQLFHLVPCPRHRMPRMLNENHDPKASTDEPVLLGNSYTPYMKRDSFKGKLAMLFVNLQLAKVNPQSKSEEGKGDEMISISNLTLINLVLVILGPMTEPQLVKVILLIQIVSCSLGYLFRIVGPSLFF